MLLNDTYLRNASVWFGLSLNSPPAGAKLFVSFRFLPITLASMLRAHFKSHAKANAHADVDCKQVPEEEGGSWKRSGKDNGLDTPDVTQEAR